METPDAAAERLRKLLLVTDAALAHLSLDDLHVGTLTPRLFTAEDAELLQRAADRAALGVERALLHDDLRRLDQVREQFVARASHELRTPAAAVYGAAATLDARADQLPPDQVR